MATGVINRMTGAELDALRERLEVSPAGGAFYVCFDHEAKRFFVVEIY